MSEEISEEQTGDAEFAETTKNSSSTSLAGNADAKMTDHDDSDVENPDDVENSALANLMIGNDNVEVGQEPNGKKNNLDESPENPPGSSPNGSPLEKSMSENPRSANDSGNRGPSRTSMDVDLGFSNPPSRAEGGSDSPTKTSSLTGGGATKKDISDVLERLNDAAACTPTPSPTGSETQESASSDRGNPENAKTMQADGGRNPTPDSAEESKAGDGRATDKSGSSDIVNNTELRIQTPDPLKSGPGSDTDMEVPIRLGDQELQRLASVPLEQKCELSPPSAGKNSADEAQASKNPNLAKPPTDDEKVIASIQSSHDLTTADGDHAKLGTDTAGSSTRSEPDPTSTVSATGGDAVPKTGLGDSSVGQAQPVAGRPFSISLPILAPELLASARTPDGPVKSKRGGRKKDAEGGGSKKEAGKKQSQKKDGQREKSTDSKKKSSKSGSKEKSKTPRPGSKEPLSRKDSSASSVVSSSKKRPSSRASNSTTASSVKSGGGAAKKPRKDGLGGSKGGGGGKKDAAKEAAKKMLAAVDLTSSSSSSSSSSSDSSDADNEADASGAGKKKKDKKKSGDLLKKLSAKYKEKDKEKSAESVKKSLTLATSAGLGSGASEDKPIKSPTEGISAKDNEIDGKKEKVSASPVSAPVPDLTSDPKPKKLKEAKTLNKEKETGGLEWIKSGQSDNEDTDNVDKPLKIAVGSDSDDKPKSKKETSKMLSPTGAPETLELKKTEVKAAEKAVTDSAVTTKDGISSSKKLKEDGEKKKKKKHRKEPVEDGVERKHEKKREKHSEKDPGREKDRKEKKKMYKSSSVIAAKSSGDKGSHENKPAEMPQTAKPDNDNFLTKNFEESGEKKLEPLTISTTTKIQEDSDLFSVDIDNDDDKMMGNDDDDEIVVKTRPSFVEIAMPVKKAMEEKSSESSEISPSKLEFSADPESSKFSADDVDPKKLSPVIKSLEDDVSDCLDDILDQVCGPDDDLKKKVESQISLKSPSEKLPMKKRHLMDQDSVAAQIASTMKALFAKKSASEVLETKTCFSDGRPYPTLVTIVLDIPNMSAEEVRKLTGGKMKEKHNRDQDHGGKMKRKDREYGGKMKGSHEDRERDEELRRRKRKLDRKEMERKAAMAEDGKHVKVHPSQRLKKVGPGSQPSPGSVVSLGDKISSGDHPVRSRFGSEDGDGTDENSAPGVSTDSSSQNQSQSQSFGSSQSTGADRAATPTPMDEHKTTESPEKGDLGSGGGSQPQDFSTGAGGGKSKANVLVPLPFLAKSDSQHQSASAKKKQAAADKEAAEIASAAVTTVTSITYSAKRLGTPVTGDKIKPILKKKNREKQQDMELGRSSYSSSGPSVQASSSKKKNYTSNQAVLLPNQMPQSWNNADDILKNILDGSTQSMKLLNYKVSKKEKEEQERLREEQCSRGSLDSPSALGSASPTPSANQMPGLTRQAPPVATVRPQPSSSAASSSADRDTESSVSRARPPIGTLQGPVKGLSSAAGGRGGRFESPLDRLRQAKQAGGYNSGGGASGFTRPRGEAVGIDDRFQSPLERVRQNKLKQQQNAQPGGGYFLGSSADHHRGGYGSTSGYNTHPRGAGRGGRGGPGDRGFGGYSGGRGSGGYSPPGGRGGRGGSRFRDSDGNAGFYPNNRPGNRGMMDNVGEDGGFDDDGGAEIDDDHDPPPSGDSPGGRNGGIGSEEPVKLDETNAVDKFMKNFQDAFEEIGGDSKVVGGSGSSDVIKAVAQKAIQKVISSSGPPGSAAGSNTSSLPRPGGPRGGPMERSVEENRRAAAVASGPVIGGDKFTDKFSARPPPLFATGTNSTPIGPGRGRGGLPGRIAAQGRGGKADPSPGRVAGGFGERERGGRGGGGRVDKDVAQDQKSLIDSLFASGGAGLPEDVSTTVGNMSVDPGSSKTARSKWEESTEDEDFEDDFAPKTPDNSEFGPGDDPRRGGGSDFRNRSGGPQHRSTGFGDMQSVFDKRRRGGQEENRDDPRAFGDPRADRSRLRGDNRTSVPEGLQGPESEGPKPLFPTPPRLGVAPAGANKPPGGAGTAGCFQGPVWAVAPPGLAVNNNQMPNQQHRGGGREKTLFLGDDELGSPPGASDSAYQKRQRDRGGRRSRSRSRSRSPASKRSRRSRSRSSRGHRSRSRSRSRGRRSWSRSRRSRSRDRSRDRSSRGRSSRRHRSSRSPSSGRGKKDSSGQAPTVGAAPEAFAGQSSFDSNLDDLLKNIAAGADPLAILGAMGGGQQGVQNSPATATNPMGEFVATSCFNNTATSLMSPVTGSNQQNKAATQNNSSSGGGQDSSSKVAPEQAAEILSLVQSDPEAMLQLVQNATPEMAAIILDVLQSEGGGAEDGGPGTGPQNDSAPPSSTLGASGGAFGGSQILPSGQSNPGPGGQPSGSGREPLSSGGARENNSFFTTPLNTSGPILPPPVFSLDSTTPQQSGPVMAGETGGIRQDVDDRMQFSNASDMPANSSQNKNSSGFGGRNDAPLFGNNSAPGQIQRSTPVNIAANGNRPNFSPANMIDPRNSTSNNKFAEDFANFASTASAAGFSLQNASSGHSSNPPVNSGPNPEFSGGLHGSSSGPLLGNTRGGPPASEPAFGSGSAGFEPGSAALEGGSAGLNTGSAAAGSGEQTPVQHIEQLISLFRSILKYPNSSIHQAPDKRDKVVNMIPLLENLKDIANASEGNDDFEILPDIAEFALELITQDGMLP